MLQAQVTTFDGLVLISFAPSVRCTQAYLYVHIKVWFWTANFCYKLWSLALKPFFLLLFLFAAEVLAFDSGFAVMHYSTMRKLAKRETKRENKSWWDWLTTISMCQTGLKWLGVRSRGRRLISMHGLCPLELHLVLTCTMHRGRSARAMACLITLLYYAHSVDWSRVGAAFIYISIIPS